MKRLLVILLIVFAVVIAALLAMPVLFKQGLLETTKATINKQVNAEVEFSGFRLSLFRGFPKATIELENVLITGKGEFENDTLLDMPFLRSKMSLISLLGKSGMSLEEIVLVRPKLNLLVGASGSTNWDLAKETAPAPAQAAAPENPEENTFSLQLEKIEIRNAEVIYNDQELNMLLDFNDINIDVNGKMFGTTADLIAKGRVEQFSLDYEGVQYISKTAIETTTGFSIDYDKMNIEIKDNELLVNRLPLEVTGTIQMPSDSMFFDLDIQTKVSGFENFLALVPPDYEEYLKDIQTTGTASLTGTVKGLYFDEIYPAFALKINVAGGNFKYADLPEEIKNIKADISINKPQGDLDLTVVKISEAHAQVKNNPVDLTLTLSKLVSDPWFDGAFVGTVNFDQLKDALPLDSVNVSGVVDANLFVKGNYSSIENEQYEKIKSDGIVMLNNFRYESPDFTQPVQVSQGKLDFSPESVSLSQFNMKIGQSDFNLYGRVTNYLNYMLKDGILKGDLQLNSSFVNIDELLRLQVPEKMAETTDSETAANAASSTEPEVLAFDVPADIDFTFRSNIARALFDNLTITNVEGLITAQNGKLMLNGLDMQMLDGKLSLTGSYQNTPQNRPLFDFGFDLSKVDIPLAYRSLTGIQRMLPVAGYSQGKFNTNLRVKGQLSPDFRLLASSVDGMGLINTENLQIIESPVFNQLKGILNSEKLKNVTIDDFKANIVVEDGNIVLKPFTTKIAGQETTLFGSLNTENLVDLRMDFKVQRDAFGADIQSILSVIPGNKTITMVPASVTIKGPVGKPDVKMDLSEARKTITDATKEDLQKSLNKLGDGLKKLFK